jgi:serine/threonine protein phosphatase PrpC
MAVKTNLRHSAASDPGKRRKNNEDRYYVDADRGIYAVIDGVGGHAAGETAAGVAVEVLRERLERQTGTPEERIREAITLANNEIFRLAKTRPEWNGMACVLTVALIEDDIATIGHVGDTRLYLLRAGEITKITHDHSPVGEREDHGEISEAEAMRHARRNEIFRDVGSSERTPQESGFIEIERFPMPPEGLLLLCSDGLTDQVSSLEVRAGIERYAPDYDAATRALVEAANAAGGKDNVTVVIVAGPAYGEPPVSPVSHGTAKAYTTTIAPRVAWTFVIAAVIGLVIGILTGFIAPSLLNRFHDTGPRTLTVGPDGITAALNQAHSGDTVVIPQGSYRERVELREGVTLRAQMPGSVILTSPDGGPAVVANKIDAGGIEGVWIQGGSDARLSTGIDIGDASPFISNVKVTDAQIGILIHGASAPAITSSVISNSAGPGIVVADQAAPHLVSNLIAANGTGNPDDGKPGVEVMENAHPVLTNNFIGDNAAEPIWIYGRIYQPADYEENYFGALDVKDAIRVVDNEAAKPKPPARIARPKAAADHEKPKAAADNPKKVHQ